MSHRIIQTSLQSHMESKNPLKLFEVWYSDACKNPAVKTPAAMSLAMVKHDGKPRAQMVELNKFDHTGFKFILKNQPVPCGQHAALVLYWELLNRQIRVEGSLQRVDDDPNVSTFVVKPDKFEFWQHQSKSMHDRVAFIPTSSMHQSNQQHWLNGEDGWGYQWLEPWEDVILKIYYVKLCRAVYFALILLIPNFFYTIAILYTLCLKFCLCICL